MSQTTEPTSTAKLPATSAAEDAAQLAGAAFPKVMVCTLLETVRIPDKATPEQQHERMDAAVTALASIDTRSPTEMMFAAHAVAAHQATMECFRRAMLATGNSDAAVRLHKSAKSLSGMMADNLAILEAKHARAEPERDRQPRLGGKTP